MQKFLITLIFSIFVFADFVFSQTIDVLVNQIDGVQKEESETALVFQDSLMDFLFESGFIASNENLSLAHDISSDENKALKSCKTGFFDYLLIVKLNLNYESGQITEAHWFLKDVQSANEISKGKLTCSLESKNPVKDANTFGFLLGKQICSNM